MDARVSKSPARRRPSSSRDPERTRAVILNAAIAEFTSKGLSGARIDHIAKRANVNKRMIYYYFTNKEGLYIAVLEETYTAIRTAEIGLNLTGRNPAATADSIMGVVGKQNIVETPSRLRISVIASMTFIVALLPVALRRTDTRNLVRAHRRRKE